MVSHQGLFNYDDALPRETNIDEVFKDNKDLGDFVKRCKAAHANGMEVGCVSIFLDVLLTSEYIESCLDRICSSVGKSERGSFK